LAPRTECERRLQGLWEELLRVYPVGVRDDFFELGGDSLLAMRLFLGVQQRFGCDLPAGVLLEDPTIEHLATLIDKPRPAGGRSSLVVLQKGGTKPPFVCVHALGGQVLGYRVLARHLGRDRPFYAVQARELSGPWPPFTRIEEMAAHYVGELLQVQPDGPYYLGGYSLGAFIAFEMAQQLHEQGREVALLAMLDDGPSLLRQRPGCTPGEVGRFLANVPRWLGQQLRRKKPGQLLADCWRKLRVCGRRLLPGRARGGQADVEEVLDVSGYSGRQRDVVTAHYRAVRDYVPRVYPGRVAVFRARTQPLWRSHQPDLGWGRLAGGGVETHVLPGDHDSIITEPDVQGLARHLAKALERAGQPAPMSKSISQQPRTCVPGSRQ
jgi:thioesterase domain-containing protein/acyl carrier protein